MIYAIQSVGTVFVKFGKAKSVGKRLKELNCGCPHDLSIIAVADWEDGQESSIHVYLADDWVKGEWFRESERTAQVIQWMNDTKHGAQAFLAECRRDRKPMRLVSNA